MARKKRKKSSRGGLHYIVDGYNVIHEDGRPRNLEAARDGLIRDLSPDGHDKSTWNIDQLLIERDPAFGEDCSIPGDSGSVWVHSATLRPVALNHTGARDADGNPTGEHARASLLVDVFARLNITI